MKPQDMRLRITALKFLQSATIERAELKRRAGAAAVAGKGMDDPAWIKWRRIGYSAAARVARIQKEINRLAGELHIAEYGTSAEIAARIKAGADLDKAIAEL